jgi:hypothetical protein
MFVPHLAPGPDADAHGLYSGFLATNHKDTPHLYLLFSSDTKPNPGSVGISSA